jgi:hypothetical protein
MSLAGATRGNPGWAVTSSLRGHGPGRTRNGEAAGGGAEPGRGSVEFVDTYSGFAGHEIGSADPYVNGLNVNLMAFRAEAQSFHPTAASYRRFGEIGQHISQLRWTVT